MKDLSLPESRRSPFKRLDPWVPPPRPRDPGFLKVSLIPFYLSLEGHQTRTMKGPEEKEQELAKESPGQRAPEMAPRHRHRQPQRPS